MTANSIRSRVRRLERESPGGDGMCRCGRVRVTFTDLQYASTWAADVPDVPDVCPVCGRRVPVLRVEYADAPGFDAGVAVHSTTP